MKIFERRDSLWSCRPNTQFNFMLTKKFKFLYFLGLLSDFQQMIFEKTLSQQNIHTAVVYNLTHERQTHTLNILLYGGSTFLEEVSRTHYLNSKLVITSKNFRCAIKFYYINYCPLVCSVVTLLPADKEVPGFYFQLRCRIFSSWESFHGTYGLRKYFKLYFKTMQGTPTSGRKLK